MDKLKKQIKATDKINKLINSGLYTLVELAEELNFSVDTLRRRRMKSNWKSKEIDIINNKFR